jgi:hypothetical protein
MEFIDIVLTVSIIYGTFVFLLLILIFVLKKLYI